MGVIRAFSGALSGTLSDQWKDIYTAQPFDEHSALVKGIKKSTKNGRKTDSSDSVITNGSIIYVPENTACVIFSQGMIEEIITTAGGYKYTNGQSSVFDDQKSLAPIGNQIKERFAFGGISSDYKQITYVNLREIRNLRFGTKQEQPYFDSFYECELHVVAYGIFSIKIVDPRKFIQCFVPANATYYSMDDEGARSQIIGSLMQSFNRALNKLSNKIKIVNLPGNTELLTKYFIEEDKNIASWTERFGICLTEVLIENISYSKESQAEVTKLNKTKMKYKTLENISSESIEKEMILGANEGAKDGKSNFAQTILSAFLLRTEKKKKKTNNYKEEKKALQHYKDLLDNGMISQEEYEIKKKEILGL